ncbi:hypothetical protein [Jiulongibacter sp. NS-SX5]|uniref:hypothetical protein n=1 Tax=Jiulongibacter sp. NS-SX5 TaxID=3463854 RepID=UPI00405935E6
MLSLKKSTILLSFLFNSCEIWEGIPEEVRDFALEVEGHYEARQIKFSQGLVREFLPSDKNEYFHFINMDIYRIDTNLVEVQLFFDEFSGKENSIDTLEIIRKRNVDLLQFNGNQDYQLEMYFEYSMRSMELAFYHPSLFFQSDVVIAEMNRK